MSPELSVVVCTYGRAGLLRGMLESLRGQTLARDAFEVVLVDDGSEDGTRGVAEAFRGSLPLHYAYQANAGIAAARNRGVALARGRLLLFLDDDDVADPRLLEAHVEAHGRRPEPEVAVLGRTRLDAALADDPLMHFVTEVGRLLFDHPDAAPGERLDFRYFWGGRSSCKRALLVERGAAFDSVFRFGCEDIELAFRLSRGGFAVVYEPGAISTMVRGLSFDEFCRRRERQGRSSFVFSQLHADLAVQRWTGVPAAGEAWRRLGPVHALLLRSGRELDRVARLRLAAGLGLCAADVELLFRGYWAAFEASRMKGIVERAAESGVDLLARPAAGDATGDR